jgi:hypothetical protein
MVLLPLRAAVKAYIVTGCAGSALCPWSSRASVASGYAPTTACGALRSTRPTLTFACTGNSTKQQDWRSQAVAQEEVTAAPPTFECSSNSLTTNEDQIEKLLAHIHKRLPRSKHSPSRPARAHLVGPPPTPHLTACERASPEPEFHSISSQLQLSLDGGGIHLSVLGCEDGLLYDDDDAPPAAEEAPAVPDLLNLVHGLEPTDNHVLSGFPGSLVVPRPSIVHDSEPQQASSGLTGAHPTTDHHHTRQREWLQQLLERPYAPASAPPQHKTSGVLSYE